MSFSPMCFTSKAATGCTSRQISKLETPKAVFSVFVFVKVFSEFVSE